MPKECFFNLPNEKQKRIIGAAIVELCKVPANEISINKIIKDAGISRGSFYQYFEDKFDLLDFIFKDLRDHVKSCFTVELDKNNGDLFQMINTLFDLSIQVASDEISRSVVKSYLLSFKMTKVMMRDILNNMNLPAEYFIEIITKYQSVNKFKNTEYIYIQNITELLFSTFLNAMTDIFCDYDNLEIYKQDFYTKLDIIKFGCIKE